MLEKFRRPHMLPLTIAAIGLAACSGPSKPPASPKPTASSPEQSGITKKVTYFPDGTRIIAFAGYGENPNNNENRPQTYPADLLQFCEGKDLYSQTLGNYGYPAGSIALSPNHPACADGQLTAKDFQINPK